MAESVEVFYDDLAESYHLMFENWGQSVAGRLRSSAQSWSSTRGRVLLMFWIARAGSEPRPSA